MFIGSAFRTDSCVGKRGSGIGQKSAAGAGGFGRLKERSQAKVGVLVLSG